MLPVSSAIQSDIMHLYLQAVDAYINVSHLPYMQSIPVLANCYGKQIDSTPEQASKLPEDLTSSKLDMLNQLIMLVNVHIR